MGLKSVWGHGRHVGHAEGMTKAYNEIAATLTIGAITLTLGKLAWMYFSRPKQAQD